MDYQLNLSEWSGMFALPNCAMSYVREASGTAVKTLLVILHSPARKPTPEEIASTLSISVDEAKDGIRYWMEKGILSPVKKSEQPVVKLVKPGANTITSKELAEQLADNENVRCLFENTETLYGRPLNTTERKTLLYIYQATLLPVDVILMVIEFCLRIDKPSMNYIMKVCESWSEQEINTHEKVEEQIRVQLEKTESQRLVMNCFGIHRKLSKKESTFIEKWIHGYQFQINMIRLAYERTVDAIGEISFPYINEILTRWHKNNIKTPEEAIAYDSKSKTSSSTAESKPSYDLEELSKRGLFVPEL